MIGQGRSKVAVATAEKSEFFGVKRGIDASGHRRLSRGEPGQRGFADRRRQG
jgi:hypothetical protein